MRITKKTLYLHCSVKDTQFLLDLSNHPGFSFGPHPSTLPQPGVAQQLGSKKGKAMNS